jgi:hypothetical protein
MFLESYGLSHIRLVYFMLLSLRIEYPDARLSKKMVVLVENML